MKFNAVVSLSLVSVAAAAGLADIPSCALSCLDDAVKQSTSCSTTDLSCICPSFDKIQGAAAGCIISACGQDVAINKVLPASQNLCTGVGPSSGGSPRPTSQSQPSPSVTVLPPPVSTHPSPPPTVTAGAAAFAPMGGLAMLALGLLAL